MTATRRDTRFTSTPSAVLRGIPKLVGTTKAWSSIRIGLEPSRLGTTTDPEAGWVRSERKNSEGLTTSTNPESFISKTPISFVEPKRFLTALKIRKA
jgi:hypothetical protein